MELVRGTAPTQTEVARRADGSAITDAQGNVLHNFRGGKGASKISGADAQGKPNNFGLIDFIAR